MRSSILEHTKSLLFQENNNKIKNMNALKSKEINAIF